MVTFKDYPEFRPNLTPKQVLSMGSFGGTYFRDSIRCNWKNIQKTQQVIQKTVWRFDIEKKIIFANMTKTIIK